MTKTTLRALTLLWSLCIITGAVLRGHPVGRVLQTTGFAHVVLHFGVFAVLGVLLMLSFETPHLRLLALAFGIALGLSTEVYEHVSFGNPMEYGDAGVDACGVLVSGAASLVRRPTMI